MRKETRLNLIKILQDLLIMYIGILGLTALQRMQLNAFIVWYYLALAFFCILAGYGVISIIHDLKKGGLDEIKNKFKNPFDE
jgi:hypothetical protein